MKHLPSTQLFCPYELELHYTRPLFNKAKTIKSSRDAVAFLRSYIHPKRISLKEFFWVMLLTEAHQVIGIAEVGSGNSRSVVMGIKEILTLALLANASSMILVHNHPSGNTTISQNDKACTKRISEVANIMEVNLIDHIILTAESYTSFSDDGLL